MKLLQKRWRVLLALLVIAGGLGLWWRLAQPRRYRLVARVPVAYDTWTPLACPSGVLTLEKGAQSVTFRDWQGTLRWKTALPPMHFPGNTAQQREEYATYWHPGAQALSHNGRFFAQVVPDGKRLRILTWKHGREFSDYALPVDEDLYNNANAYPLTITVSDTGSTYLWATRHGIGDLRLIERGTCVAEGTYRSRYYHVSGMKAVLLPEVGTIIFRDVYGEFLFSRISVNRVKNVLRLSPDYHVMTGVSACLSDGTVIGSDRNVYGASGKIARLPPGWDLTSPNGIAGVTGPYALLEKRVTDGQYMIYAQKSSRRWRYNAPNAKGGAVLADGNGVFLVSEGKPPRIIELLCERLQGIHVAKNALAKLCDRYEIPRLELISPDGRMQGQLCGDPTLTGAIIDANIEQWAFAPDGRAFVLIVDVGKKQEARFYIR